ncbi:hypothetical protein EDM68_00050 [Candidatus Uhrbacteria bacterium]|nr:MAG: hypothetical protein EDM68_00050 [Candidatus Uhrbacteria bacterium]
MAHARTFLKGFCAFIMCALPVAAIGCTLDRSVIGCVSGETGDDTGRCMAIVPSPDGGTDAFVAMMDAEVDAGTDAGEMPDAWVEPDAGPDDGGPGDSGPPDMDGGTDAGRDSGPPDAGTDACVPRTEICGNGVDEDCSGADDPCPPLVITFNGATGPTGIVFRVIWIPGPAMPPVSSAWYYHACDITRSGAMVTARCDAPELASGRGLEFFPYDHSSGTGSCSVATCPSLCTRTTCPGYPAAYAAEYDSGGGPLAATEWMLYPDSGTASDGPAPGDSAYIWFRLP